MFFQESLIWSSRTKEVGLLGFLYWWNIFKPFYSVYSRLDQADLFLHSHWSFKIFRIFVDEEHGNIWYLILDEFVG